MFSELEKLFFKEKSVAAQKSFFDHIDEIFVYKKKSLQSYKQLKWLVGLFLTMKYPLWSFCNLNTDVSDGVCVMKGKKPHLGLGLFGFQTAEERIPACSEPSCKSQQVQEGTGC